MSIGKHAFNLSLCFLEPKCMTFMNSGLSLSFASQHRLFDILNASVQLITSSHSCVTDGNKVGCHRHRNGSLHLCVYQSVY